MKKKDCFHNSSKLFFKCNNYLSHPFHTQWIDLGNTYCPKNTNILECYYDLFKCHFLHRMITQDLGNLDENEKTRITQKTL